MLRLVILSCVLAATLFGKTVDSTKLEIIHREEPIYPKVAKDQGIYGRVIVKFEVGESGEVLNAQAISGDPLLQPAAVDSVKQSKFKPFIRDGHPVKVTSQIPIDFSYFDHEIELLGQDGKPVRVRVKQEFAESRLRKQVPPEYPKLGRSEHITGSVILDVLIDIKGSVKEVKVVSGHPWLANAAKIAVSQWKYEPFELAGRTVEVSAPVTINFALAGR